MQAITRGELARLTRLELARSRDNNVISSDRSVFDWYADSCPCGLPPGECRDHPRARPAQRPPGGDWRTWVFQGGRGAGKSFAGANWLIDAVRRGVSTRPILVGQTAADVRDVMVATILEASPPWFTPTHYPSRRALVWPNGTQALLLSAEDPEQARGPNADLVWADEMGSWSRSWETWRNLSLALRKGSTRSMVTTTPRRTEALLKILEQPTTVVTRSTSLDNARHLSEAFTEQVVSLYGNTRFYRQEVEGELIDQPEGAVFACFDESRHVGTDAEFSGGRVHLGIDCGTSRTTGAVLFQVDEMKAGGKRFRVFGDHCQVDVVSSENARQILGLVASLAPGGDLQMAWLDPASAARSSLGPAARSEYERVFGMRRVSASPQASIADGLQHIEILLGNNELVIHPRCRHLIDAMKSYEWARVSGQWVGMPKSPQSPHEDMVDALRYGVRAVQNEGRKPQPRFTRVHAKSIF